MIEGFNLLACPNTTMRAPKRERSRKPAASEMYDSGVKRLRFLMAVAMRAAKAVSDKPISIPYNISVGRWISKKVRFFAAFFFFPSV